VFDEIQRGFLAGDEYLRAAELRAEAEAAQPPGVFDPERLPGLVAEAAPETLGRLVLALAALHEPDERGWCAWCVACRPGRWRWRRRGPGRECPTRRVMWAELYAVTRSRFTSS
jgi:hypothetical protein